MQEKLLQWICCPLCQSCLELTHPSFNEESSIISGTLFCGQCRQEYPIVDAVPWVLEPSFFQQKQKNILNTAQRYGFLWEQSDQGYAVKTLRHVERVIALLGEEPFKGKVGIDAGAGIGDDTEYLARRFPNLTLLSLDISSGVNKIQKRVQCYPNVHVIRASVLQLPLRSKFADFIYSYGVLHHTPDPRKGFAEFVRVLKPKGQITLYLYEDHAGDGVKREFLKLVRFVRKITVRIPPRILFGVCWMLSPIVVLCFSWPARLLGQFPQTKKFAQRIPFNFGRGLWSVTGDLYDRFSAPYEFRFSAEQIERWYQNAKFDEIQVGRLRGIAGLVSAGRKL